MLSGSNVPFKRSAFATFALTEQNEQTRALTHTLLL